MADLAPLATAAEHPPLAIPDGLTPGQPPRDPARQFLAWGIDQIGAGHGQPGRPRWMVVQWVRDAIFGDTYWAWSVPGRQTSVEILGWAPLSRLDYAGAALMQRTERANAD